MKKALMLMIIPLMTGCLSMFDVEEMGNMTCRMDNNLTIFSGEIRLVGQGLGSIDDFPTVWTLVSEEDVTCRIELLRPDALDSDS